MTATASGEERLPGGHVGGAVRVGGTVRRPAGPWTPAVHALLAHLAPRLPGVPEVLGFDDRGREVLSLPPRDGHRRPHRGAHAGPARRPRGVDARLPRRGRGLRPPRALAHPAPGGPHPDRAQRPRAVERLLRGRRPRRRLRLGPGRAVGAAARAGVPRLDRRAAVARPRPGRRPRRALAAIAAATATARSPPGGSCAPSPAGSAPCSTASRTAAAGDSGLARPGHPVEERLGRPVRNQTKSAASCTSAPGRRPACVSQATALASTAARQRGRRPVLRTVVGAPVHARGHPVTRPSAPFRRWRSNQARSRRK